MNYRKPYARNQGVSILPVAGSGQIPSALRLASERHLHTFRDILNTALLLGGSGAGHTQYSQRRQACFGHLIT
jgi:hypothetical protein